WKTELSAQQIVEADWRFDRDALAAATSDDDRGVSNGDSEIVGIALGRAEFMLNGLTVPFFPVLMDGVLQIFIVDFVLNVVSGIDEADNPFRMFAGHNSERSWSTPQLNSEGIRSCNRLAKQAERKLWRDGIKSFFAYRDWRRRRSCGCERDKR